MVDSSNNLIGGMTPGTGNTIAYNSGNGVDIDSGTGNSIFANSIFSNGGPGIFLNSASTANDNQTAPVLTSGSTSSGGTSVSGTLASVADTTFRIEFFANQGLDPSGNAEGQTFLGFATVTTDNNGNATFTAANLAAIPAGEGYLTATATNESTGDTSQFSNYLAVPTSMLLTSSANPSFFGLPVTLTATVSASFPGFGTPTGSVNFVDTTTNMNLGSVPLSGGTATLTTAALSAGPHEITATYNGNPTFLGSSATLTQSVSLSILVLDPTAGGALSLSGNAGISVPGAVVVDSSSKTALTESGSASIKAGSIQVVGGVSKSGNATLSPAPTTGVAVVPDPLAGLAVPVASSLGLSNQGSVSLSGNSTRTISPGIYSQITVSGYASLTLQSGVYILAGGGLTVSGNASIAGNGVVLFNAGSAYNATTGSDGGTYGSITLSGNGTYALSAPTTGTYSGILIFQDRNNTRALTLSGNSTVGTTSGTIYAKAAALTFSGNAQSGSTQEAISFVVDTVVLSGNSTANGLGAAPTGTVAYTPAQIRDAYGISNLSLDGTGQTIAIVDAYDDPDIYQALDTFDTQFGLTAISPSLYQQYGPASSFLTVLNQAGQATGLPGTDPAGAGSANWELEESLDVEWAHAIAPGAQIVLVEADSQSLSDLMASVATAASQPGVSVVSMSWGFPEGVDVLGTDEALYDATFTKPGVTFVASTGDYGAADPEYPAFSPNVVAVGGTSLTLNTNNTYNSETGWGYYSAAQGTLIGSGGGISQYEPEPAYQQGVQPTGYRTTPDVSFVADPLTGAWIADPYNLPATSPFEVVGGTSLSAPAWAGLLALVNQGLAAAGEPALNSTSPTQTQQDLYSLSQADYYVIASGNNGYSAAPGYNLVTGLGTPEANLLVPDLVAGNFPATGRVAAAGAAQLVDASSGGTGDPSITQAMNVFDALLPGAAPVSAAAPGPRSAAVGTLSALSGTDRPGLVSTGLIQGGGHLLPGSTSAAALPASPAEAALAGGSLAGSIDAGAPATGAAAGGLPAPCVGVRGNVPKSPAAFAAWVMPPAAGSGGEEDAADTMPASADPSYLDACGPAGADAVPVPDRGAASADQFTGLADLRGEPNTVALDAFFGSVSQVEGIGGGIGAGRVDAPAGGWPALAALLGAVWMAHAAERPRRRQHQPWQR